MRDVEAVEPAGLWGCVCGSVVLLVVHACIIGGFLVFRYIFCTLLEPAEVTRPRRIAGGDLLLARSLAGLRSQVSVF